MANEGTPSPARSLEEIDEILQSAKINPADLYPASQVVYFSLQNLHNNNFKFLELDDHLMQTLSEGSSVVIAGGKDDNVVICTDTCTYDVAETETSNSLLLVEGLKFQDGIQDVPERSLSKVTVSGIFYDYLEVTPGKPRLQKLKEMLSKAVYRGPELEDEINSDDLFTYEDLLNSIQASKKELDVALQSMHVVRIGDKIRMLDFEYHFRCLSYMLNLIDENSWAVDEIDYEETANSLGDLVPIEILNSLFDLYAEPSKIVDSLQLYKYKETDVCRLLAEGLLYKVAKFNLNEFMQAWTESVPEGMSPTIEMLHGVAVVDKKSTPNVISPFPENQLPEGIMERFKCLFEAKEKWTVPEIAPYIQCLTTDKTDVNALLAKHARASTINGMKYYSAKHAK